MKITILTLFPDMFSGPFEQSIIKRAREKSIVAIEYVNIRDFGIGRHQVVDDTPYGGGVGMVLKVDVLHKAIDYAKNTFLKQSKKKSVKQLVVLMSASGIPYKQDRAKQYAAVDHLIIVCGHYEGVDERIINYIDEEISIGDYILTGGEIPAMVVIDSVIRLLKGTITQGATIDESFSKQVNLLEY